MEDIIADLALLKNFLEQPQCFHPARDHVTLSLTSSQPVLE